jgi:hypothetical protein
MRERTRRSERIPLTRPVSLVYHNEIGHVTRVPGQTTSVNCHGAGICAVLDCPEGSQVYMLDSTAGVGVWGRVVSRQHDPNLDIYRIGLEFTAPGNYWRQRLLPPDWVAHLPQPPRYAVEEARLRRRIPRVRVRAKLPGPIRAIVLLMHRLRRRRLSCRCCGSEKVRVFTPAQHEILCRTCFNLAA